RVERVPNFADGPGDCGPGACEIVLFDRDRDRVDGVEIAFADPAPSGGIYPAQLPCVAWPTDGWATGPTPGGVSAVELQAAVDDLLASDADAVVVVHGGSIVAEGYDREMSVDSINNSFSVSKTFVGTMIGLLVDEGLLELDAPAPVPEWSAPDDPRRAITLRHLMNMASGLEWNESYVFNAGNDIIQMILTPDNASYVASKPLESEPGTVFEYSTGTTQILARIVADTLDARGDDLRAELDARLFDVLGQTESIPLDDSGVWRGGGNTDMTTRDFAKLGLLHLRGGVWEGEQLVSRSWIEFMHTPSPASAGYGGQIWRRGGFVEMVGLYGQKVTVRPDLDLVVASNTPPQGGGAGTERIVALFESALPPSCTDEPVLIDDEADTAATTPVGIPVLANDPGRGAALRPDTLTVYDPPGHGTATVEDGEVVYEPAAGFAGTDTFTYLVCTDAPFCDVATVTVIVQPWDLSLYTPQRVAAGDTAVVYVDLKHPQGVDLTPVSATTVEIDCETSQPVGEPVSAMVAVSDGAKGFAVDWTTSSDWSGCRRLLLTFGDGSTPTADVAIDAPKG
ncbi:MAG: serine hydrolase, partial [Actinomycetota bacterium]